MLQRLEDFDKNDPAQVNITDVNFAEPFKSGLEYNCPAHGTWNIVHTGMLVPSSHQIYICTSNCNRGVVLTAAEMGAMDRFSTIAIEEQDILFGNLETQIIDGVTDIIEHMAVKPRAVLVFSSCVHDFMGCDMGMVYSTLRARFPDIKIADCYMDVIRKKTWLTAEQVVRRGIYGMLDKKEIDPKKIAIIGNSIKTYTTSDIHALAESTGCHVYDLPTYRNFDDFMDTAKSALYITTQPVCGLAGDTLAQKFGAEHLYLSNSFNYGEIRRNVVTLAKKIGASVPDMDELENKCTTAIKKLKELVGDTPIAVDYVFTHRVLSLSRMLVENGFNLRRIYADVFLPEEEEDFHWLQENAPYITVYATIHPRMRLLPPIDGKYLAIGQKAAFFTQTEHFVNLVEGGGLFGFDGILRLCQSMEQAFNEKKDTHIIQRKGLGGVCVL